MIRYAAVLALGAPLTLAATPAAAQAQAQADAPLIALVKDFVEAERTFDQKRLAGLITDDYAEISPLGELDLHDAFLGFYAADKKQPSPPLLLGDVLIRHYGSTASIFTSLLLARVDSEGHPHTVSIRAGFLAVKADGKWKLASAQYTPERPKAPAAAK